MSVRQRATVLIGMVMVVVGLAFVTPAAQADMREGELRSVNVGAMPAGWFQIPVGQGRDACRTYYVCVWTGTDFTGSGLGMTGTIARGDWTEWFGSVFQ